MSLTRDEHTVEIGDSTVTVTGRTGSVHATWALSVDGVEADSAAAAGEFTLTGTLADGSAVRATVRQSLLGPTEVTVSHDGADVATFEGFVA